MIKTWLTSFGIFIHECPKDLYVDEQFYTLFWHQTFVVRVRRVCGGVSCTLTRSEYKKGAILSSIDCTAVNSTEFFRYQYDLEKHLFKSRNRVRTRSMCTLLYSGKKWIQKGFPVASFLRLFDCQSILNCRELDIICQIPIWSSKAAAQKPNTSSDQKDTRRSHLYSQIYSPLLARWRRQHFLDMGSGYTRKQNDKLIMPSWIICMNL